MTTTPGLPLAGASSLEKLPAELIENIFIRFVRDVRPPVTYANSSMPHLRCNDEIASGTCFASVHLAHRFVGRTLKDSSWRAFTNVIGEAVFGIRSKESMEHLAAVSRSRDLAPWIQKLHLCCCTVHVSYPLQRTSSAVPTPVPAAMEPIWGKELIRIRSMDNAWYPEIWQAGSTALDTSSGMGSEARKGVQDLIESLSECLDAVKNLRHVCYESEYFGIPARFRKLATQYSKEDRRSVGLDFSARTSTEYECRSENIGLHILAEAMAAMQLTPKVLELAVEMNLPRQFFTCAPLTTMEIILRGKEELILRDHYTIPHSQSSLSRFPRFSVPLTTDILPALRFLSVESSFVDIDKEHFSVDDALLVSSLEEFCITDALQSDLRLLTFLDFSKGSLRAVTLRSMEGVSYKPILNHLRSFNLDLLTIYDGYEEWWEDEDDYDPKGFRDVPARFWNGAAKRLVLDRPDKEDDMR